MKRILSLLCALSLSFSLPLLHVQAAEVPQIGAKAYALVDAQSGQLVCGENAQEKRPMASTTKIMTTLLTLESGDLDRSFTVDAEAIRVEGSSMGLREGDIVTKRALCIGMLLPSGNDAANAAAVAVAGNIPDFLAMMNARAKAIGMTHSFFATPSGLDAEGHGASAYDMALLAREALNNPDFADICAHQKMQVTFGDPPYARTLTNTNKLLAMDERVIGVKTGFTDAAGRCLVSAMEQDGRRLICVTLFDRSDWDDHLALYEYGFSVASAHEAAPPEGLTVPIEGADITALPVYVKTPLTLTAWDGRLPKYSESVLLPPFVTAPVQKGDVIGTLRYTAENGMVIAVLPLIAAQDAPYTDAQTDTDWKKTLWNVWDRIIAFTKSIFTVTLYNTCVLNL